MTMNLLLMPLTILYKDANFGGNSLRLKAPPKEGFRNVGTNDLNGGGGDNGFNDAVSSIKDS